MSQTIGKFELLGRLGEGAMGTVYRARDPSLDREVALKTVSPAVMERPDALPRFRREARAAARLQHPNIVTVYELGEVDGLPFIAMELLEGIDLAAAMRRRDQYSTSQLLRLVVAVCRGLDFAHKHGVVHRDVKPANIRVLSDGSVKLLDFGIARMGDSHMTRTGMVLGTPVYIAPEVLRTGKADHRSDLWSVGIILYEILSGHRPYDGDSIATLAYKVVHEPLPPLSADVPRPLAEVTERSLQKDPAQRYADLAELALALEMAAGLSGPLEGRISEAERASRLAASLDEAQRRLRASDLEGALAAARQAQALAPARTEVLELIEEIEARLDAPTLAPGQVPGPAGQRTSPTVLVNAPERHRTDQAPALGGLREALRDHGPGALREAAIFGEPPGTQTASLSPAGPLLAVASSDGAIRLWDVAQGRQRQILRTEVHQRSGHEAVASVLAFSPDGGLLASGHVDGLARLWHLESGREYPVRLKHTGGVPALAFSPDATLLATGCTDGDLRLWDVVAATNGEARRTLHRQPAAVTALAYAREAGWLATAHANRVLRILDVPSGRLAATLRGPNDVVTSLRFDEGRLLAAGRDRALRIFDVSTRRLLVELSLKARPTGFCLFDAGRVLAVVSLDNALTLYDADDGTELARLWGGSNEAFAAVAAPQAAPALVVALADGRLRTWLRA